MRVMLYTEKTIPQSLTALNARMQVKGSGSRPGLEGWVEKSGRFALSMTAPVVGKFERKTTLYGKLIRQDGYTIAQIDVPSGASRRGVVLMIGAVALVALGLAMSGSLAIALILIPLAAYLVIPMRGDHQNSALLLNEVQKTLKARTTPPKRPAADKDAGKSRVKEKLR